jgi:hypothetical protein
MRSSTLLAVVAALAGTLFARRRSRFPFRAGAWSGAGTGFWRGFPQAPRPAAQAWGSGFRTRRRGILSRVFGFFWGLFWVCFGLSFAFGGSEYRDTMANLFTSFGQTAASFFTSLFGSVGGLVQ